MVHVHQILVHKGVMAVHFAAEATRLVGLVRHRTEIGKLRLVRNERVAREDEDQPRFFAARIGAHAIGQTLAAEIRNVDAAARTVVSPAVM